MQETIFRLIALRSGTKSLRDEDLRETPLFDKPKKRTKLFDDVVEATGAGKPRKEIVRAVRLYRSEGAYLKSDAELPDQGRKLLVWFDDNRSQKIGSLEIGDSLVRDFESSDAYRRAEGILANTIFADAIDPPSPDEAGKPGIAIVLKLLTFLERHAADSDAYDSERTLGELIFANTIVIPSHARVKPRGTNKPPKLDEPEGEDDADDGGDRLNKLDRAFREVTRLIRERGSVVVEDECEDDSGAQNFQAELGHLKYELAKLRRDEREEKIDDNEHVEPPRPNSGLATRTARELRLSRAARDRLSGEAQETLHSLNINVADFDPVGIVARVEEEIEYVGSTLRSEPRRGGKLLMHGGTMDIGSFKTALSPRKDENSATMAYTSSGAVHKTIGGSYKAALATCKQSVGIGDLLMVKQTIKAYQVSEFAHVENVLAGESREREHRRLNVREEISTRETETEVEEERDLQSTTRSEMQNEVEKTIKNEFGLEAGLQVSGSYGPSVSFSASLNTSFSSSTEESQRKATAFSREVTEKTSERIRERVREEQRRRVLEEIEEINRHKVENPDAANGHVRGIYRWLNKIYDAQVLRYGQRMMFEFVIPEPAAFFLYAMVDNPPDEMLIEKPEEPEYIGAPLRPSHLTRTNYHRYVSEYKVSGVRPPPAHYQTVTLQDNIDYAGTEVTLGRSGKFEIPAGYEAYGIRVHVDHVFEEGEARSYRIVVGGESIDATPFWGAVYRNIARTRNELSIAYSLMAVWSYTLGADLYCELTTEGYEKWKLETYDSIMQSYLDQKAAYDEQLRAREIQEGIRILGRNPLENRRIERDELRKLVMWFITGGVGMGENVFYPFDEPIVDIAKACPWGKYVQFFENAFEWRNLMYVLYPYFWGRHARWVNALHLTDPDPDFAAFLKAGAARVQVPVRPGFEKAIAYYCQTGLIWNGEDPPLLDDELYVPIVQEITENLGGGEEGVPYPEGSEPWEVTIPTSLVLVQDLDEIPELRDVLTGDAVDILNAD